MVHIPMTTSAYLGLSPQTLDPARLPRGFDAAPWSPGHPYAPDAFSASATAPAEDYLTGRPTWALVDDDIPPDDANPLPSPFVAPMHRVIADNSAAAFSTRSKLYLLLGAQSTHRPTS